MAEVRPLFHIAEDIRRTWPQMNTAAKPYWEAMQHLNTVHDDYYYDSGKSIVMYFLSNASSWRGDQAKRIKAELREILKSA